MFYFLLCFSSFLLKDSHTLELAGSTIVEIDAHYGHASLSRGAAILLRLLPI
jgi:hypothetical protein